ncbi:MAG: DnaJ domain-containing protein [Candidatus Babeliales bacterium]|jgi:hypothetical protein
MIIKKFFLTSLCCLAAFYSTTYSSLRQFSQPTPKLTGEALKGLTLQPLRQEARTVQLPQTTIHPKTIKQMQAELMPGLQPDQPLWTTQKLRRIRIDQPKMSDFSQDLALKWQQPTTKINSESSDRGSAGSQTGMFRATAPRLMSRQQAANILGVSEYASLKDIQSAYIQAAKKAHPDAGGSNEAMREVIDARDLLSGKRDADEQREQEGKGPKKPYFSTKAKLVAGAVGTTAATRIGIAAKEIHEDWVDRRERTERKKLEDLKPRNRPENMTDDQLKEEKYDSGHTFKHYILGYDHTDYTHEYAKQRLAQLNAELAKRHATQEEQRTHERATTYEEWANRG